MNSDYAYLDTMDEVLMRAAECLEEARQSHDDVRLGAYLGLAVSALKTATLIYRDHLAQNRAEMKQGEK